MDLVEERDERRTLGALLGEGRPDGGAGLVIELVEVVGVEVEVYLGGVSWWSAGKPGVRRGLTLWYPQRARSPSVPSKLV